MEQRLAEVVGGWRERAVVRERKMKQVCRRQKQTVQWAAVTAAEAELVEC